MILLMQPSKCWIVISITEFWSSIKTTKQSFPYYLTAAIMIDILKSGNLKNVIEGNVGCWSCCLLQICCPATDLHLWCGVLHLEAESDLNEVGADGVHTEPGGTMYIVGGDRTLVLEKAEGFKGEACFLLLSIDSYYCLAISVAPWWGQIVIFFLFFRVFHQVLDKQTQYTVYALWFSISLVHKCFHNWNRLII